MRGLGRDGSRLSLRQLPTHNTARGFHPTVKACRQAKQAANDPHARSGDGHGENSQGARPFGSQGLILSSSLLMPEADVSMKLCQRYTYIALQTHQTSHRDCFSIFLIYTLGLLVCSSLLSSISVLTRGNPRGHHILYQSEYVRSPQADGGE
jgi:hypothetical protein